MSNDKRRHELAEDDTIDAIERRIFLALLSRYGVSEDDFRGLARRAQAALDQGFPLSILRTQELSSLEAIVKYLRENKGWHYGRIAKELRRKPASLAVTYLAAKRKHPAAFSPEVDMEPVRIPFSAFKPQLSVLESICRFLKAQGKTNAEAARLLGKDPRTVWTVLARTQRKLKTAR